jgi:steroid Delta-isomerase
MEEFSQCTTQLERVAWYKAVARRYIDAVNGGDVDAILACYAEDAEVHDPVFQRTMTGKDELRTFYEGVVQRAKLKIVGPIRGTFGNAVATPVVARIPGTEIQVITITHFNEEGLVQCYQTYWGPDDMTPTG